MALEPPVADSKGIDAQRLGRIDRFIKETYLDTGRLPHAQILISHRGRIVHFSSQGPAREDSAQPLNEGSIFRIASMTKPITSVGFMMLVEEGKVSLDMLVEAILPEFRDIGVYAGGGGEAPFVTKPPLQPMRMVDLLRHTSGLTYGFQNRTNVDAAYRARRACAGPIENWHGEVDLDDFIRRLSTLPLEFSPGEAWNYSVSTDVLGAVIQRVSGQPLDTYLQEKIFSPLQMNDTGFVVPADKAHRLTDCYAWSGPEKGRVMFDSAKESLWLHKPKFMSGGGGLVSTALDYHRFCRMCAQGGTLDGVRVLGRKTLALMTQNHLPRQGDLASLSQSMFSETQNAGIGFGLGVAVTVNPALAMIPGTPGEFYWGGMFSTAFFVDPAEDLHMVFLTQSSPSWLYPLRRELKTLIYSALT